MGFNSGFKGLNYFQAEPFPVWVTQLFSNLVTLYLLAYENGTECSETSAYTIQTPGNYPEENIQHVQHCPLSELYLLYKVFRDLCRLSS